MTINKFSELPRFKEENTAELKAMGISTVADLAEALNDEGKFKEIIKNVSGVGPKTAEEWKEIIGVSEEIEETEVTDVVEPVIVEPGTDTGYRVNAKPELDAETVDALANRAIINGRRPAFKRQEWFRYAKLGDSWRKPKGRHSKMREGFKRRPPLADPGYRGPVAVRGFHPSGFEEVLVHNIDGLEGIDPKVQAVRIGGTVGTKKRIAIEDRAEELGIRVLNRMV